MPTCPQGVRCIPATPPFCQQAADSDCVLTPVLYKIDGMLWVKDWNSRYLDAFLFFSVTADDSMRTSRVSSGDPMPVAGFNGDFTPLREARG